MRAFAVWQQQETDKQLFPALSTPRRRKIWTTIKIYQTSEQKVNKEQILGRQSLPNTPTNSREYYIITKMIDLFEVWRNNIQNVSCNSAASLDSSRVFLLCDSNSIHHIFMFQLTYCVTTHQLSAVHVLWLSITTT